MKTGLIVVGGAAAVGAALFAYKKHEDNKKRKEYFDNPANFLPPTSTYANTGTTVFGGSGGSETAPAGSKLVIVQSVGNVAQGATLPLIEVQVTDGSGVPLTINGLAIEAGCLTPQPCSLTGGKNVTTVNGKAAFDSLVFNQAHSGVKLQFSASGVATVSTPSFDVTGNDSNRGETSGSTSTSTGVVY